MPPLIKKPKPKIPQGLIDRNASAANEENPSSGYPSDHPSYVDPARRAPGRGLQERIPGGPATGWNPADSSAGSPLMPGEGQEEWDLHQERGRQVQGTDSADRERLAQQLEHDREVPDIEAAQAEGTTVGAAAQQEAPPPIAGPETVGGPESIEGAGPVDESQINTELRDLLAAKGRGESFAGADLAAQGEFERAQRAIMAQKLGARGMNPAAVLRAQQQATGQLGRERIATEAAGAREAQIQALGLGAETESTQAQLDQQRRLTEAGFEQEVGLTEAQMEQERAVLEAQMEQERGIIEAQLGAEAAGANAERRQQIEVLKAQLTQELNLTNAELRQRTSEFNTEWETQLQVETDKRLVELMQQGLDERTAEAQIEAEMIILKSEAERFYWDQIRADILQRAVTAEEQDTMGSEPEDTHVVRSAPSMPETRSTGQQRKDEADKAAVASMLAGEGVPEGYDENATAESYEDEEEDEEDDEEGDAPSMLSQMEAYKDRVSGVAPGQEGGRSNSHALRNFHKRAENPFEEPDFDRMAEGSSTELTPSGDIESVGKSSFDGWGLAKNIGSTVADWAQPVGNFATSRGKDRNKAMMGLGLKAGIKGVGALYDYMKPEAVATKALEAGAEGIGGKVAEGAVSAAGKAIAKATGKVAPAIGPLKAVAEAVKDPSLPNVLKAGTRAAGAGIGGLVGGPPGAAVGDAIAQGVNFAGDALFGGGGGGTRIASAPQDFSVKTSAIDELEKLKRRTRTA